MKALKTLAMGVLACALAVAPSALAEPEHTVASAHAFISQVLGAGTVGFDAGPETVNIDSIESGGCITTLSGLNSQGKRLHRVVDWAKVTSISWDWRTFSVVGPIELTDGTLDSNMFLDVDNAMHERLGAAMNFIKDSCDTTRSTGW